MARRRKMLATSDAHRAGATYNSDRIEVPPVSEDPDLATVASLIDNEHARRILTATSVDPMSATELTERCDASLPTVYRVLDRLQAVDLVEEGTRLRDDGHHDTVYLATLDGFEVSLEDGTFELSLSRRDRDPAAELKDLWEKF